MSKTNHESTTATRTVAVIVHHGDPRRTIKAVINHWHLNIFSDVIVIANDLSPRPKDLDSIPCTWTIPDRNIGFGGACQLAATTRRSEFYAFFNAHVIIDRTSVNRCIAALEVENVGIASPYIFHPTSGCPDIDWKYTYCRRTYSRILRRPIQVPLKDSRTSSNLSSSDLLDNDWATGGALFCRHEIIRNIGWNGSYFLGFEDVDICMRAKNRGWRIVIVPSATAFHTGESTRTSAIAGYYATRNHLWFARRYRDRRVQALLTLYLLLVLCRVAMADVLKGRHPPHARAAIRGILHGWFLWPESTDALPGEPLWPGVG